MSENVYSNTNEELCQSEEEESCVSSSIIMESSYELNLDDKAFLEMINAILSNNTSFLDTMMTNNPEHKICIILF
jgi:hypothetical protein